MNGGKKKSFFARVFNNIKDRFDKGTAVEDTFKGVKDAVAYPTNESLLTATKMVEALIERSKIAGQYEIADRVSGIRKVLEAEIVLAKNNMLRYITEEQVVRFMLQSEKGVRMEIERTDLEAPVTAGEKAGTYTLYVDDREIQTGDLYAAEDIEKGWILSKLYVPDKTGALLCVFLVLWVILFALARRMPGTGHGRKASKKDAQKP